MDELPIKINELSPIVIAFIEKIQLLDSPILNEEQKVKVTKEMSEVVDNMRTFFAKALTFDKKEELKLLNERIERAFSQFDWNINVAVTPYQFKKFSETGKSLISSILKLLGKKGCGILIIETYLMLCINLIAKMSETDSGLTNLAKNKANFKLLLEFTLITVNLFNKYWCIVFSQNQKNKLMLCFYQMCKSLTFLLKATEIHSENMIKYALSNLKQCFNKVLVEIHCNDNQQTKCFGEEFITLMNFCLYKLNEISNSANDFSTFIQKTNETVNIIKPMIDEILCCVLSIAKITNNENDNKIILIGSQKVLNELNDLNKEIEEKNINGIKLNACSLGESLCSLEHQVNTAVLRLILEVFSGVNSPLKNIVNSCRANIAKDGKTTEDLNDLISEFDVEVDRIIQIGLFATSCTSNLNKILRIQCSLTSLESLETELIPSVTALYLDCNLKNKADFQYLVEFWLSEISDLKMLIDSILDLPGFCKVVEDQITQLIVALKKNMFSSNICIITGKSILNKVVKYSKKLIKTINTGLEDEKNEKTYEYLNNFQLVVQACETVKDLINNKEANKIAVQIIKRCDVLLNTINKLTLHLFDSVNNEESNYESKHIVETENSLKLQIPQKDYYKLCDSVNISALNDIEILKPCFEKKELLLSKKKVLYTTLTRMENFDETVARAMHWEKTPISRKRSRCCKPLNFNLELENTIDLEITAIIEKISDLSNTFSHTLISFDKNKSVQEKNEREFFNKGKDVACSTEDIDYMKSAYKSSGCCARLDSLDQNFEYTEGVEYEQTFVGNKLRNRFLEALKNLSQISSLSLNDELQGSDAKNKFEISNHIDDLKFLEEKITFLKQQISREHNLGLFNE